MRNLHLDAWKMLTVSARTTEKLLWRVKCGGQEILWDKGQGPRLVFRKPDAATNSMGLGRRDQKDRRSWSRP